MHLVVKLVLMRTAVLLRIVVCSLASLSWCCQRQLRSSFCCHRVAIARAREILGAGKTMGAYTHSQGYPSIRKNVAKFIEARDGHPADPETIYLTDGASPGAAPLLFDRQCVAKLARYLLTLALEYFCLSCFASATFASQIFSNVRLA